MKIITNKYLNIIFHHQILFFKIKNKNKLNQIII